MNKQRYIASPSYRKTEKTFAVKVLWLVVGILAVLLLAWAGFFQLEGGLPQQTNASQEL